MKKLNRADKAILREARRIRGRLNEGGGAGVNFVFEDVEIGWPEIDEATGTVKADLEGELTLRSYQDASIVISKNKPLGTVELDLSDVSDELVTPGRSITDMLDVEVNIVDIDNVMHGAGFARAGYPEGLDVYAEVEVLWYDPIEDDEEYEQVVLPAYVTFAEIVNLAYEDLDEPDRYEMHDEHGEPIEGSYDDTPYIYTYYT